MNNRAAPPPLQKRFEQEDEILRLLLDFDVAVAHNPEKAHAFNPVIGEKLIEEEPDHRFQRQEARA